MLYEVAYAHDHEVPGLVSLVVVVEAPDEEHAVMKAGMARAESFTNYFMSRFYLPQRLQWRRLYVARLGD